MSNAKKSSKRTTLEKKIESALNCNRSLIDILDYDEETAQGNNFYFSVLADQTFYFVKFVDNNIQIIINEETCKKVYPK